MREAGESIDSAKWWVENEMGNASDFLKFLMFSHWSQWLSGELMLATFYSGSVVINAQWCINAGYVNNPMKEPKWKKFGTYTSRGRKKGPMMWEI
jgi:hypothetical protein